MGSQEERREAKGRSGGEIFFSFSFHYLGVMWKVQSMKDESGHLKCALKTPLELVSTPGPVNGKQSGSDQVVIGKLHTLHLDTKPQQLVEMWRQMIGQYSKYTDGTVNRKNTMSMLQNKPPGMLACICLSKATPCRVMSGSDDTTFSPHFLHCAGHWRSCPVTGWL